MNVVIALVMLVLLILFSIAFTIFGFCVVEYLFGQPKKPATCLEGVRELIKEIQKEMDKKS